MKPDRTVLAIVMDDDLRVIVRTASKLEHLTETAFARRHLLIAAKKIIARDHKERTSQIQP